MNIWGASTMGCSYSPTSGVKFANTDREARTAKYNIVSSKGNRYAITSFEDACDDVDFDDLVFALTPANAFAEMAEIADGKTITTDVFAFEDMWPDAGDYDMNDVVVNCKNEKTVNTAGKVTKQTFYMTTYRKNVALVNGLAARVKSPATTAVVMKKMAPGETDVTKAQTVTYETFKDGSDGTIYYLTSQVEDDLGSTYIIELTYKTVQDATALDNVIEPFIYRKEDDGKYWEVHIPYAKPTSRMNTSYFGQLSDRTNVSKGEYFVRAGLYPFAFHLTGTKAEHFFDTILSPDDNLQPIDEFYPDFRSWSSSRGQKNADWYLHKK
jgi:LruC domain-containing protein